MKTNRFALLAVVLVILFICVVIGCLVAYFLLEWQPDDASSQPTVASGQLEATPVPGDTVLPEPPTLPATPTFAPDAPLATEPGHSVVGGGELPTIHRIAFDQDDVLHLVWGNTEKGFFHHQRIPGDLWQGGELLTGDFETLLGFVDLMSDSTGQVCAFFDAATDSNVPSTLGMYMRCFTGGQWTPVGALLARGDWLHPPALDADGSARVVQLDGPGRAPVRFGAASLSSEEEYIHALQWAIDQFGSYHVMWVRSAGDSHLVEYCYSNDGGQTWSEAESMTDMPPQMGLLSLMADGQGNVHAVSWTGAEGVYHKRWTPTTGWELAVRVNGEIVGGSWGDAAIGPDGLAHIVWGNEFAGAKHYVRQRPDGSWSQPRPITDEAVTDVRLAIDSHGSRHFVWRGPDDGLYHLALPPATLTELGGIEGKVLVMTDKAEYDAGEAIRISVINN
jgi:hypothetical protein